jgi:hypothetical protein
MVTQTTLVLSMNGPARRRSRHITHVCRFRSTSSGTRTSMPPSWVYPPASTSSAICRSDENGGCIRSEGRTVKISYSASRILSVVSGAPA